MASQGLYIIRRKATVKIRKKGSREEDKVSGFFVLSDLWMRGYFRLG